MVARTLMLMGTASSTGKSLLTTAVCRCLSRRGLSVAPFKAQNMSNNAAVCDDGGEIGRSQYLQAIAAGVRPHTDMNPVLLKPEGETRSQVIVNGRSTRTMEANDYFQRREQLWPEITAALDRLRRQHDVVVIEGAGSPAELNLAGVEMVNLSVARYAQSPVLLIGDIERGGVFAQLLGTLWLLDPGDRERIAGLIVNKFRGALSLFDSGKQILYQRGGVPVLGVLPWLPDLNLPEEDAVALDDLRHGVHATSDSSSGHEIDIAVIRFPHIANFDDFDPLTQTPGVRVRYVQTADALTPPDVLGGPDAIILPGTKNSLDDMHWLMRCGLAERIKRLHRSGTPVVGICGGYQMLGRHIENPHSLESNRASITGLGLLPVETVFHTTKQTRRSAFRVIDDRVAPGTQNLVLSGYEIHCGRTESSAAWLERESTTANSSRSTSSASIVAADGCVSSDGRVWGCYLHGIFHNDPFLAAWLRSLGKSTPSESLAAESTPTEPANSSDRLQASLDRLADHFETHIDMAQLNRILFQSANRNQEPSHVRG